MTQLSLLERYGHSGEDFSNEERLRQESLDLAGSVYRDSVFFGKLVKTGDGNDVLQFFMQYLPMASYAVVPSPTTSG